MAITVAVRKNIIYIIPDTSTDINIATYIPDPIYVTSIKFFPSATNDVLMVRDGSATAVFVTTLKSTTGGDVKDPNPYPRMMWTPYIKASDCTFASASATRPIVTITFLPYVPTGAF